MVERCHLIPHLRSYDNARHTWGVCTLLHIFWPEDPHLVTFALFHDVPERWTGDVPGQVLASDPRLAAIFRERDEMISSVLKIPSEHALVDVDYVRVKACDRLDFWLWTFDEEALGNRNVIGARDATTERMMEDPNTPPEIIDFMVAFSEEGWQRHKETF